MDNQCAQDQIEQVIWQVSQVPPTLTWQTVWQVSVRTAPVAC